MYKVSISNRMVSYQEGNLMLRNQPGLIINELWASLSTGNMMSSVHTISIIGSLMYI